MSLDRWHAAEPSTDGSDDRRAFRRRRWQLRRGDRAGRRRPDGVHAARADRLRRAVLRTASSRRRAARREACRSTTCCARSSASPRAGFKEIALTGVHLGSYGRDLTPRVVADRSAARARRLARRASSRQPTCCSASARSSRWTARREIVDLVATSPIASRRIFICRCSTPATAMLAAMRRPYTIEYYAALVDDIRARMPHASIGSDIIVGFPGETDDDFDAAGVVSRALAADAPARVSRIPIGRARRRRRWRRRSPGAVVRERGAASCARSVERLADGVPRVAGRHDASRADARRRLARS